MNRIARALGPALFVIGITATAACAAPAAEATGLNAPHRASQCKVGGDQCRWDGQCCSGRCYVDTGCSG